MSKKSAAEQAEIECEAQLAIIRAIKPLSQDSIGRVLAAVKHILDAEDLVPGIIMRFTEAPKQ